MEVVVIDHVEQPVESQKVSARFFLVARLKQWSAPSARGQEGSEQNDGVDAGASLARPIDVAQVQPESKLIERECGANAVKDRHQPTQKN